MISQTPAFKTSDGKLHANQYLAQLHEIGLLMTCFPSQAPNTEALLVNRQQVIACIYNNWPKLVEVMAGTDKVVNFHKNGQALKILNFIQGDDRDLSLKDIASHFKMRRNHVSALVTRLKLAGKVRVYNRIISAVKQP